MALINYTDKDKTQPVSDVRRLFRDVDANEVKNVVNANALREWDNTLNKFPDAGGSGDEGAIAKHNWFVGNGVGNWETATGRGVEQVVDGTIFIARFDNPGQDPAKWRTI
jgi:hypothetical protein